MNMTSSPTPTPALPAHSLPDHESFPSPFCPSFLTMEQLVTYLQFQFHKSHSRFCTHFFDSHYYSDPSIVSISSPPPLSFHPITSHSFTLRTRSLLTILGHRTWFINFYCFGIYLLFNRCLSSLLPFLPLCLLSFFLAFP